VVQIISAATIFTTGIFLTIVRIFEPLFRLLLVKQIYEFWGILREDVNKDEKSK
jgi:hypothetical protein